MKNTLKHNGTTQLLLANVDDGTNRLFINDVEIPSSRWVGSGTYTQTINGVTISITKIADATGNIMLQKISDTVYKLVRKEVIVTPPFSGATANTDGTQGDVPKPLAGQQNKYLRGDGSWNTPNLANEVTGTLPVSHGGTGQTSLQATRNAMGLGNTLGALPVANGGTGASTAANARSNLGITPVAIWTGSVGNATAVFSTSVTLSQSYKNFRILRFFVKVNYNNRGIESRRYIRDVSTQQINEIRNLNNANYTIGIRWGWQAETEYVDIIKSSTDTVLQLTGAYSVIYRIEGIA